jgi:hypothetical protein
MISQHEFLLSLICAIYPYNFQALDFTTILMLYKYVYYSVPQYALSPEPNSLYFMERNNLSPLQLILRHTTK